MRSRRTPSRRRCDEHSKPAWKKLSNQSVVIEPSAPRTFARWVRLQEMGLFLGPDEHRLADQQEQNERRPRGNQRRISAGISHRETEIVGNEISEAERHSEHRADEQLAGA